MTRFWIGRQWCCAILLLGLTAGAQNLPGSIPVCDMKTVGPGPFQIVGDANAADLLSYLSKFVLPRVRENWYSVIPPVAMPPLLRQGCVVIEFDILKDGSVSGMKYVNSSGDVALDRAAFGGVAGSSPLPSLPKEFSGEKVRLRFNFVYNPTGAQTTQSHLSSDLTTAREPIPTPALPYLLHTISAERSPARPLHIVEPEYPRQARKKKIQGSVTVKTTVDTKGRVAAVSIVSGNPVLAQAAKDAVQAWTFEPFTKSGQVIAVQQVLTINFQFDWKTGELDPDMPPATSLDNSR